MRTRSALRAIRFIDRHLTTKVVLVVTVLLLVASWIYPPWIYGRGEHGWAFLFDTSHGTMRVDFGRLYLIDAIVATTGGLVAWTVSSNSTARRVTIRLFAFALILLPIIAVVCLAGFVISEGQRGVQREVEKRAAQIKPFDWSTGALIEEPRTFSWYDPVITYLVKRRPVTVGIPGHGLAEFPAGMSSEEIAAVIKKKFGGPTEKKPWEEYRVISTPSPQGR